MHDSIKINLSLKNDEVPNLRELVGWERRDNDYPQLFERCNFWAGCREANDTLITFGYVCGTGLQHGYMEDIMVHAAFQNQGRPCPGGLWRNTYHTQPRGHSRGTE